MVVIFETRIDLSSFDEGNFYLRTFRAMFSRRRESAASDGADVLCEARKDSIKFHSMSLREVAN